MLLVEIITLSDKVTVPAYATIGSAAVDIYPNIDKPIDIYPGETKLIPTGFKVSINYSNYCLKLYPRSGAGVKGMVLGNCVGIIDSDYQEEVFAAITNRLLEGVITVEPGKACCQMILEKVEKILFAKVDSFTAKRGERIGGFGSTDKKNMIGTAPVYGHLTYTCPDCKEEYTPYIVDQVRCVQCEMVKNPIMLETVRALKADKILSETVARPGKILVDPGKDDRTAVKIIELKPGKIQIQGKCALCEGDFPADTLVTIHGKHWCKNCSREVI